MNKEEKKVTLSRLKKFQKSLISGYTWIGPDSSPCLAKIHKYAKQLNDEINSVARGLK